ncbi:MAG: Tm-1-like ATP-binding domain-containing protein [Thermoleophilia bacterium]
MSASATKTVLLVTNIDTRGAEFMRVRDLVREQGLHALVMDISMEQPPPIAGDVTCEEVAHAGGLSIEEVRAAYRVERKVATDCMIRGGGEIAARLFRQHKIHGALGVGGATATLIATSIMKRLPFGVPKVMASSVGSHPSYVGRYVGTRDIMMLNTVVDVMGMNPLLWRQLSNAVGAACGAVKLWEEDAEGRAGGDGQGTRTRGAPVIGITSFGFAERSVEAIIEALRELDFEPVPFHAQGRGDRAMDEIVRDGLLHGVVDVVIRGVGEEMLGGNCAAGPDRISAAAQSGVPQVLAPSGLDMLSVGGQQGWEQRFAGRAYAVIDELRVEVRTSADECRAMARVVAARLNEARAPFLFLLPLEGWSSLDRPGGALWDPEADAAFAAELRAGLRDRGRIREVPGNLYTPEFGVACADAFAEVWAEHRGH